MAAPADMSALSQQTTAKLVLLGEQAAGKSSLVLRYVKGQFFDYQVRPGQVYGVPAVVQARPGDPGLGPGDGPAEPLHTRCSPRPRPPPWAPPS